MEIVTKEKDKKANWLIKGLRYYKQQMLKKHLILYCLNLVVFGVIFTFCINQISAINFLQNIQQVVGIPVILGEFGIFVAISLILGMVPYLYVSILPIVYASRLASYITNLLFMRTDNKVVITIMAVVLLFILSFTMTVGMNMCRSITKKITSNKKSKNSKKENH